MPVPFFTRASGASVSSVEMAFRAEESISVPGVVIGARVGQRLAAGVRGMATGLLIVAALLAGTGWLYVLRGLGWFDFGPGVRDSLPLLQLAGYDVQPLGRVIVAWLAVGAVVGIVLVHVPRARRVAMVAVASLALLLLLSQASFALTRNVRLQNVLWSRLPGTGPWLEAVLLAVGSALAGWKSRAGRERSGGA